MKTKRYAEAAKKIQMRTAITLVVTLVSTLVACSGKDAKSHVFKPKLDVNSTDKIVIAGNYANFEALEAEIDRFNTYYPNVEIVYNFLDNYNNLRIGIPGHLHDIPMDAGQRKILAPF